MAANEAVPDKLSRKLFEIRVNPPPSCRPSVAFRYQACPDNIASRTDLRFVWIDPDKPDNLRPAQRTQWCFCFNHLARFGNISLAGGFFASSAPHNREKSPQGGLNGRKNRPMGPWRQECRGAADGK